jgi:hypothetical protein
MNQNYLSILTKKLVTLVNQIKAVLQQDYSVQDLNKLSSSLKSKLLGTKTALRSGDDIVYTQQKWDFKRVIGILSAGVVRYRVQCLLLLMLCILYLLNLFVIAPFSKKVQDQLEMRPAQWSALLGLIKQSRVAMQSQSSTSGLSLPSAVRPATVTLMDEMELQKIRNLMTARGIKPNLLRLTADNPPRVEFQASDVMFSVLVDVLDELRANWRLYPIQLQVVSGSGVGIVNISGVLAQYSGQAELSK